MNTLHYNISIILIRITETYVFGVFYYSKPSRLHNTPLSLKSGYDLPLSEATKLWLVVTDDLFPRSHQKILCVLSAPHAAPSSFTE